MRGQTIRLNETAIISEFYAYWRKERISSASFPLIIKFWRWKWKEYIPMLKFRKKVLLLWYSKEENHFENYLNDVENSWVLMGDGWLTMPKILDYNRSALPYLARERILLSPCPIWINFIIGFFSKNFQTLLEVKIDINWVDLTPCQLHGVL